MKRVCVCVCALKVFLVCILTSSSTSAILQSTSSSNFFKSGTDLRNSTFSSIRCNPVRIMICWKARLSSTHTREFGFIAKRNENLMKKIRHSYAHKPLIEAVRLQLYKIANSPKALPADSFPKILPPTSISNSPSAET